MLAKSDPVSILSRKTVHGFISACCRVDLASCGSKLLTSSGLRRSIVFPIGQEAYSAKPTLPFEQPATRTTLGSVPADMLMRWVSSQRSDPESEDFVLGKEAQHMQSRSVGRSRGSCPRFPEGSSWAPSSALMDWVPGLTFYRIFYERTGTHHYRNNGVGQV